MTNLSPIASRANTFAQRKPQDADEEVGMKPDFLDPASQAEIAAGLDAEMALELEGRELMAQADEDEEAEAEADVVEQEREMQKQIRAGGYGLGGWVDRMMDWTLFGSDESGGPATLEIGDHGQVAGDGRRGRVKLEDIEKGVVGAEVTVSDDKSSSKGYDEATMVERPKEEVMDAWEDAAWLLRVATQLAL